MFWKHLHPGKVLPPRPFPPPPPPTPYQLHAQNQFHAGCGLWKLGFQPDSADSASSLSSFNVSITSYAPPEPAVLEPAVLEPAVLEPAVLISETAARAIVAAIDDNRPHRAAHLIKELPWFAEILSGVRATRHLKPVDYITLSERPWALMKSL